MSAEHILGALDKLTGSSAGASLGRMLDSCFAQMEWAEDEIKQAQQRHPDAAAKLHDTFLLIQGTHELMGTEFVYRAHACELLERVYAGEDCRPPTDVEIVCGLSEASLRAPLNTAAITLYMRLFARLFPDKAPFADLDESAYEHVAGDAADHLYRQVKRARGTQQRWRVYPLNDRDLDTQLVFDDVQLTPDRATIEEAKPRATARSAPRRATPTRMRPAKKVRGAKPGASPKSNVRRRA
jgi:hypothetical protein